MSAEQFDLFLILLKLKSYLISLIDNPDFETDSLEITEEFLDRKYPELKSEIIEMFIEHKIHNDSEIAFNDKIHVKFKEMVKGKSGTFNLASILEKYNIQSVAEDNRDRSIDELRIAREQKLKEIVTVLFQLARLWTQRSTLEENVDDFSILDEEELIRPDEEKELGKLDRDTFISFNTISKISNLYLEQLIEYYFQFGGDLALPEFIEELEALKKIVKQKYSDLLNNSGLNPKQE